MKINFFHLKIIVFSDFITTITIRTYTIAWNYSLRMHSLILRLFVLKVRRDYYSRGVLFIKHYRPKKLDTILDTILVYLTWIYFSVHDATLQNVRIFDLLNIKLPSNNMQVVYFLISYRTVPQRVTWKSFIIFPT